ncbi:hypothetical protein [Agreia sp. Leaf283]|uniref:hypothetical protein n=1 Tax=Agreia sp. Leaf283 TaxID=1736321 RepID=UPI0012F81B63|nr:hypothetical protein [Agreia sp. Leaf283]
MAADWRADATIHVLGGCGVHEQRLPHAGEERLPGSGVPSNAPSAGERAGGDGALAR